MSIQSMQELSSSWHMVKKHHDGVRLTPKQVRHLLSMPDDDRQGIRDAAMLALGIGCGLMVREFSTIRLDDLHDDYISLRGVKRSKRIIHYREMKPVISKYLNRWIEAAGFEYGPVFRRIKRYNELSFHGIDSGHFKKVLNQYQLDNVTFIRPLDMRLTFAKMRYDLGHSLEDICRDLGYLNEDIAEKHVGELTGASQRAKAGDSWRQLVADIARD